jgi:hypothetical protein
MRGQTNPDQALAEVQTILREDRFLAEAMVLEVNLLEKLGRTEEAVQARERLQFADPAFVSGPRVVAGGPDRPPGDQKGVGPLKGLRLPRGVLSLSFDGVGAGARSGGAGNGTPLPVSRAGGGDPSLTALPALPVPPTADGKTGSPQPRAAGGEASLTGARTPGTGGAPSLPAARAGEGAAPLPAARAASGGVSLPEDARKPAAAPSAVAAGALPSLPGARAAAGAAPLASSPAVAGSSSGSQGTGKGASGPRTVPGETATGSHSHDSPGE